ncbi:MAG: NADAR family protein [Gemmatimonadales bacterium]
MRTGRADDCTNFAKVSQKALLFDDRQTAERIMQAGHPRTQKVLGRQVRGFLKEHWDAVAREVVYRGNWAKFTQDPELHAALLATAGTTLVEASPSDTIWGIGLGEDDPRARDRASWLGTNWLGEVLTRVRDDLLRNQEPAG